MDYKLNISRGSLREFWWDAQQQLKQLGQDRKAAHEAKVESQLGHAEFIQMWRSVMQENDFKTLESRRKAELLPALGQLPASDENGLGATNGFARATGHQVYIAALSFNHVDSGLPAMWDWLRAQGCSQPRYEFDGLSRRRSDGEVDED